VGEGFDVDKVAEYVGEFVRGPGFAAVAAAGGGADQPEASAGLVLVDGEVPAVGVPVAGAAGDA